MSRPSKSAKALHPYSQSKEEMNGRIEIENKLRGEAVKPTPSNRLNSNQKKVFNEIVNHLEAGGILGGIDNFILELCAIAIDRLQAIEKMINQDFELIMDRQLMAAKEKYSKDFYKCCNELSLSPQSRAKFGIMAVNKMQQESDPLLAVLKSKKSG